MPKKTRKDTHKTRKLPFPHLETAKNPSCSTENLSKTEQLREKVSKSCSENVSGEIERGPFGEILEVSQSRKKGKTHSVEKSGEEWFRFGMVLYFMVEALNAFN